MGYRYPISWGSEIDHELDVTDVIRITPGSGRVLGRGS